MKANNNESLQVGDFVMHSYDKGIGFVIEAGQVRAAHRPYCVTWFNDDSTQWVFEHVIQKVK